MSGGELSCPRCSAAVRLREDASRRAGKLVYACRACARKFSFLGGDAPDLVEDPALEDPASRTARLLSPEAEAAATPRLRELEIPSEASALPTGIALTLEFLDGPQRGRTLAVTKSRSTLGRDPVEVHLEDPLVSRRHAVLEIYDAETVILQDLSSTNGTWHNGHLIARCKLTDGDEVRLGSSILTVVIDHPRRQIRRRR